MRAAKRAQSDRRSRLAMIIDWIIDRPLWFWAALGVTLVAFLVRLPQLSHGMDQWDVVLYKDSLVGMRFFREAQWPILLLFQKSLWLALPQLSPQQILSLTNILFGAVTLGLLFYLAYVITKSYLVAVAVTVFTFFMPVFGVYSVVGMQDMAEALAATLFVTAVVKFCTGRRAAWLYLSGFIAGLALGVRATLILLVPALVVAMLLVVGWNRRQYLRAAGAYLAGVIIWAVADRFIAPLPNSHPLTFFWHQFTIYNPSVLGIWKKAGTYILFSGYQPNRFFWFPLVWLVIYGLARLKKGYKLGPLIAAVMGLISAVVAIGLGKVLSTTHSAGPWLMLTLFGVLVAGEAIVALSRRSQLKLRDDPDSIMMAVLVTLILSELVFNFVFASPVMRYLLTAVPATLLLILILTKSRRLWTSWLAVGLLLVFGYWACSFTKAQTISGTFKTLDPRSSVAVYVGSHAGHYYNFSDSTVMEYLQSYGVDGPVSGTPTGCPKIATPASYAILYGPVTPTLLQPCPQIQWTEVAKYQRHEEVIEDSVGNIGYFIYRLTPAS